MLMLKVMKTAFPILLLFYITGFSLTAQIPWELTNGPEGGALSFICNNDTFAFWGDRYKLYRTVDGKQWESLPYENMGPMGMNNRKIAAWQGFNYQTQSASLKKFLVSYDHGLNWKEGTLPPLMPENSNPKKPTVCTHGIYLPGGASNFIYKTTDDGMTWSTIQAPGYNCYDLYTFEDRLFTLFNNKFYRLDLNGVDWELVSPDFGKDNSASGIYISGLTRIFSTQNFIVTSIDDGLNWKKSNIGIYSQRGDFVSLGNRIYKLGNDPGLTYTEDSGLNWTELNSSLKYSLFDLSKAGGKLLASSYNKGVLSFDESIHDFVSNNKGLNSAVVYALECNDELLWAACGNGVFAYDLNTFKWLENPKLPLSQSHYLKVSMNSSGYVACCEWNGSMLYLSKNRGLTWDTLFPLKSQMYGNRIALFYWLNDVLIVRGSEPSCVRSEDLGKTWMNALILDDMVMFKNKIIGLQKGNDYLHFSNDLGKNWQRHMGPGPKLLNLFGTGDRLFLIAFDDNHQTSLYYSDDGDHWIYANDGLPNFSFNYSSPAIRSASVWKRDSRYFLYDPFSGLYVTLDSCKTWLPVEKAYYSNFIMSDSHCYAGGFGGGVIKSGIPQNFQGINKGIVFNDANDNGIRDQNENALTKIKLRQLQPCAWFPDWVTMTNSAGHYFFNTTHGCEDTLSVVMNYQYPNHINPPYHISNGNNSDLNFGIHFDKDISDASISGTFVGRPIPGITLNTLIQYQNEGNLTEDGMLSIQLDPKYQYISANPPPDAIFENDSLVWNFKKLSTLESRQIIFHGRIATNAQLGNWVCMRGHIKTASPDNNLMNNDFEINDSVVVSYKPTEKIVEPKTGLTRDQIIQGKELFYTIRFQNLDNHPADRIRITDQLDTAFNLKSIRYIASSHPVSDFKLLPGGLLAVTFDSIALPDILSDEAGSQGFVKFAIQLNKSFNPEHKIKNFANIYFDDNHPIQTNLTFSEVLDSLDNNHNPHNIHPSSDLFLFPNPANDDVQIFLRENIAGPIDIVLFDMKGKKCFHRKIECFSKTYNLNTQPFDTGFYLLAVKGQQTHYAKLLIQH